MRLYQGKTLLIENADFAAFTQAYAQSVQDKSPVPFLLLRDDEVRLLVVTHECRIMLCWAEGCCLVKAPLLFCKVSYTSTYMEGIHNVSGLTNLIKVEDRNLIEPSFAIKAIQAFFNHKPMTDFVDFGYGLPEPEIMTYPSAFKPKEKTERVWVEMHVTISEQLKEDIQKVCDLLENTQLDRDGYFDSEDAIRVGSLCGESVDRHRNIFDLSYFLDNGETWHFTVPRTILDGIATGNITTLKVRTSVPKQK